VDVNEATYWDLLGEAERWLDSKRATLWGKSFDLSQVESKREAAHWLVSQVEDLYEWSDGAINWTKKLTTDD
jgi:predicted RNA-binding protein